MEREYTARRTTHPLALVAIAAAAAVTACGTGGQPEADTESGMGSASATHGEDPPAAAPHPTGSETMEVAYSCAAGKAFDVAFDSQDEVRITIDGEVHTLERAAGHSGLLFASESIVFFSKGREATVEIDGAPAFTDCEAQGHPE